MLYEKAGLRMLGGGQKRGNIPILLACRNVKYEKIDRRIQGKRIDTHTQHARAAYENQHSHTISLYNTLVHHYSLPEIASLVCLDLHV
jgi:hypothetical protein